MTSAPVEQHHPYSASGSYGWMNCPGKLVMEKGIPDSTSAYADEGSAAHFLAAKCLQRGKHPESYRHFGIICWVTPDGHSGQSFFGDDPLPEGAVETSEWKIGSEFIEHVGAYVDYVRGVAQGGELMIEQQVVFGDAIGAEGAFGTADAIVLSEDGEELTIIDLKYGMIPVQAHENPQLSLYALGVLDAIPEEAPEFEDGPDFAGWYDRAGMGGMAWPEVEVINQEDLF